jgi:DNA-binding NtrC family response regulator
VASNLEKNLLIIDDDRFFCDTVSRYLSDQDYEIVSRHTKEDGEKICRKKRIDVVLLDQKLPDGNGIDLCSTILKACEQTKIIFITAFPSFDNAVKALKNGAFDYLSKPLEIEEVGLAVNQAFRTLALENVEQIQEYKNRKEHDQNVLIGRDAGLRDVYKLVELSAVNDVPVLITGETGTGKNVAAKSIHYLNDNSSSCFMGINCASLPENLIEAELFGHEKGAFTGAVTARKGIFEMADGGTLFLDEIGELPLHLQSKLLGVLDDKTIKRIGGQSMRRVSVRIIAAANVNLEEAVRKKLFRQDLYYRLSVLGIHLPPLRNRQEDIAALCNHFILTSAHHDSIDLPESEIEKLQQYPWPGNVRELKNVIERSLIFKKNNRIYPSELLTNMPLQASDKPIADADTSSSISTLAEVEENHIMHTLTLLSHNHTRAAQSLGISRSTLLRKLKNMQHR